MSNHIPDIQARLRALDVQQSFCVTAPAGSGKTELLIQRYLKLLCGVSRPEEILAITFTRKAAAEMKSRVIAALEQAANTEPPSEEHARITWELAQAVLVQDGQQQWRLLANPNRLQIQTIDSFCAALTRQMPLHSILGGPVSISDSAELIYQDAVRQLLDELDTKSLIADQLETLLLHLDNRVDRVERLLVSMLKRRDQWLPVLGSGFDQRGVRATLEQTLQTVIGDALDNALQETRLLESQLVCLADYAATNLTLERSDSRIVSLQGITSLRTANRQQWEAIAELLLTGDNDLRLTVNKNQGFPTETPDGNKALAKSRKKEMLELLGSLQAHDSLLDTLVYIKSLPPAEYDNRQWALLEALTRLLPRLVAYLKLEFQKYGEADYTEVSQAAQLALGTADCPTDLALALDYRIKHILIDEFQDTSAPQFSLLEKLTSQWVDHNEQNPICPNTLFIVGDGMQSVYGFRDADVSLFLKARDQGVSGLVLEPLELTTNFRSTDTIVNWVNQCFSQTFPQQDDLVRGAVQYKPSQAIKTSENSSVQCLAFTGEQGKEQEAEAIVGLIQQQQAENPERSIAILVRGRSHLLSILPQLRKAGIHWRATDIDSLADSTAVRDLLHLCRALMNIADRIAWLSVLRAPWCGLSLADLHALTQHAGSGITDCLWFAVDRYESCTLLSDDGRQRLASLVKVLRPAMSTRQRKSLRVFVEGVWLALSGPALIDEPAELDNALVFLDFLEQQELAGNITDLAAFETDVAALFSQPAGHVDCTLQIMTLHKAKGLEFDTVILPALDKQPPADEKPLLMWQQHIDAHGNSGLLLSPIEAVGGEDPIYKFLRTEKARRTRYETTRIFYVGATRAVSRLVLTANLKEKKNDGGFNSPPFGSLLGNAWEALAGKFVRAEINSASIESMEKDVDSEARPQSLRRISSDWFQQPGAEGSRQNLPDIESSSLQKDAVPKTQSEPVLSGGSSSLPDDVLGFGFNRRDRYVGTILHETLQWLVEERLVDNGELGKAFYELTAVEQRKPHWQARLKQLGLHTNELNQAVDQIQQAVTRILTDKNGLWLMDSSHTDSACELALCSTAGNFVIDRTFIDSAGTRWIIDYKSAVPKPDQSLTYFLNEQQVKYYPQLLSYRALFEQLGEAHIKTALYFPGLPLLYELTGTTVGTGS